MNWLSKVFFSASAFALVATLTYSYIPEDEGSLFCNCSPSIAFDAQLPISHPVNRCAEQLANEGVSWSSWVSGHSYSFHFIDLLELLSRFSDTPKDNKPTQS